MTCSVQEFFTLSKFLFWSFQNEQFWLKNTVLQNFNTHKKESIMDQNKNTSVDQFWAVGIFFKAHRLSRFQHFFLTQNRQNFGSLAFFQWDVKAISHVALPSIIEEEITLTCRERADFSPPTPLTLQQPLESAVVAAEGNAWLWQPGPPLPHPVPRASQPPHSPSSHRAGSNCKGHQASCCWGSTASSLS